MASGISCVIGLKSASHMKHCQSHVTMLQYVCKLRVQHVYPTGLSAMVLRRLCNICTAPVWLHSVALISNVPFVPDKGNCTVHRAMALAGSYLWGQPASMGYAACVSSSSMMLNGLIAASFPNPLSPRRICDEAEMVAPVYGLHYLIADTGEQLVFLLLGCHNSAMRVVHRVRFAAAAAVAAVAC